jgi:hypothetical protein
LRLGGVLLRIRDVICSKTKRSCSLQTKLNYLVWTELYEVIMHAEGKQISVTLWIWVINQNMEKHILQETTFYSHLYADFNSLIINTLCLHEVKLTEQYSGKIWSIHLWNDIANNLNVYNWKHTKIYDNR